MDLVKKAGVCINVKELDDDAESIINERYIHIGNMLKAINKKKGKGQLSVSDKNNKIVANRILALPIFVVVMFLGYALSMGASIADGGVSIGTFLVPVATLTLIAALSIRGMVSDRKAGKRSCGGNCASCGACGGCSACRCCCEHNTVKNQTGGAVRQFPVKTALHSDVRGFFPCVVVGKRLYCRKKTRGIKHDDQRTAGPAVYPG